MKYNETMLILIILISVILIIIEATRPQTTNISKFELDRRHKSGELTRRDTLRAKHEGAIATILRLDSAILLVIFVTLAVIGLDWLIGVTLSVVLVLIYQPLASLKPTKSIAAKLFSYYEKYMLDFCEKFPRIARYLSSANSISKTTQQTKVYSKDELLEAIKNSPDVLTKPESRLVKSALTFSSKLVSDIMTPRSMINSISHDELLGPVTLTELHQTGHSRFPVIEGDIDHVVGMLYVRELLAVDSSKNSSKASQVMDREVCFIRQDQSLDKALAAFLKTKKLLFVVINEFRETVGLLSMEDVMEALLGQKINDEFEKHTDLRAVAERNPRKNNSPDKAYEVK